MKLDDLNKDSLKKLEMFLFDKPCYLWTSTDVIIYNQLSVKLREL